MALSPEMRMLSRISQPTRFFISPDSFFNLSTLSERPEKSPCMSDSQPQERFRSFQEFYPYYLSEHQHPVCRGLHYTGSLLALVIAAAAIVTGQLIWLLPAVISGYAFAWVGHFFFEHNRPATFTYPLWSFIGDWVMLRDFLLRR